MSILVARRLGLFSSDYRIERNGADAGILDLATFRSRATFSVDDVAYELLPDGLLAGRFLLQGGGRTVASAQREQLVPPLYRVRLEDRVLMLQAAVPWRRHVLRHGDRVIGAVRPRHPFTRNAVATFHDELPPRAEFFILALVLLRWRRRARAARS